MMHQRLHIKKQFGIYAFTCLVVAIPALVLLLQYGYKESFLRLNAWNHPLGDQIMPHLTHIGEGALLAGVFALLVRKKNLALVLSMACAMLSVASVIAALKFGFFDDWYRPLARIVREDFNYVAPIDLYSHAFPSGHSTAALCLLAFYAQLSRKRPWAVTWGLVACLAAYTRVYIGVHYVGDILAGGMLGLLIASWGILWLYPRLTLFLEKKSKIIWEKIILILAILTILISLYELIRIYYW